MRSIVLACLGLAAPAVAQTTSVLFIGNSYTEVNDLPNTFRQLALSLGDTVEVAMSAPGGYRLEQHWKYEPTQTAIASRPWDVVVLQEQSQVPAVHPSNTALASCFGSARLLVERIKENRECTLPVFYMTWGRENGDDQMCPTWPPVCTFDGMQALLRERYLYMALENYGRTAPVGVAWKEVRDTHPEIDLYQGDGSHPTVEGTYLAACVFYSTVFRASCVGASFTSSVAPATATVLQDIASSMVLDSAGTWRLDGSPGLSAWISGTELAPPSILTLHHPGQGQHQWICSDGQTSTDANPVFHLEPGNYTMTHIYTDLCGITDTMIWDFMVWHVSGVGVEEVALRPSRVSATAPGTIEVEGGPDAGTLTVFDLQGRLVLARPVTGGRLRASCPAGPLAWMLQSTTGVVQRGRVVVP